MRIVRIALGLLMLGGCNYLPEAAALDVGSVVITEKTLGDHLISVGSGKDCSTVRTELGMTYCKEDEITLSPAVYCYRTLGDVTCYPNPDSRTDLHPIGENGHNTIIGKP